jgi:predicted nucleic acid-binding protein
MATPVFVDTGAHYALTDAHDPDHEEARRLLQQIAHHRHAMVTSNFVLSERYTLIVKRLGWEIAMRYQGRHRVILSVVAPYYEAVPGLRTPWAGTITAQTTEHIRRRRAYANFVTTAG